MSEYDTVESRTGSIEIKDGSNWIVITDEVKITLYPNGENQIIGKSDGICQWFLWTNDSLTAKVERAAKNHDRVTANVYTR